MPNRPTSAPRNRAYDRRLTTKVTGDVALRLRMSAAITKQPIHKLVTAALDHWLSSVEELNQEAAATSGESPK